jgi:hypothetical protein
MRLADEDAIQSGMDKASKRVKSIQYEHKHRQVQQNIKLPTQKLQKWPISEYPPKYLQSARYRTEKQENHTET